MRALLLISAVLAVSACGGGSGGTGGGGGSAGGGTGGGTGGGATGGGSGGSGGGSTGGGSGGAGGGAALDAGSLQGVLAPSGLAALVFDARIDAGGITLDTPDASVVHDGGGQVALTMGPDGRQFSPAAVAGIAWRIEETDAGFLFPSWGISSADGGTEPSASRVTLDETGFGQALITVPHFSSVRYLEGGMFAGLDFPDGTVAYVGGRDLTLSVSILARYQGFSLDGEIVYEAIGDAVLAEKRSVSFTDSTGYYFGQQLRCLKAGTALVRGTITLTRYPTFDLLPNFTQPTQTIVLERRVHCIGRPKPGALVVLISPPPPPPPPPEDPLANYSRRISIMLNPNPVPRDAFTVTVESPCGLGNRPCKVGETVPVKVLYKSTSAARLLIGFLKHTLNGAFRPGFSGEKFVGFESGATEVVQTPMTCVAPGLATLRYSLKIAEFQQDHVQTPFEGLLAVLQCGGEGDAVMLSDNTRLTRSGATWTAQATGVTANLIASSDAISKNFAALNAESVGLDGIGTFSGRVGLPRFRFVSGRQSALWSHNGTGYTQSGLVGGAAYNATDTFTVTGLFADGGTATLPDAGPAVVSLSAPSPLPPADQLFGPRQGLSTLVRIPDGTFDVLYVSLTAPSSGGGTGGVFRTVQASQMVLDGGLRQAPVLDADATLALQSWGLDAGTVYIAAYRQQQVEGFFTETDGGARPVPVQAGRMVQVNVADLAP